MKNIKTFEDACEALKLNPSLLPDVSAVPEQYRKRMVADYKIMIITEAINAGWKPNWNDSSENKYFPWFRVDADEKTPSGFGFSDTRYGCTRTHAGVGSRLCFKTSEMALYAANQFEDLYKDWHLS